MAADGPLRVPPLRLYLSEHTGDCQVGGLVHFVIPDVDAWHREFQQKGVRVTDPPNNDLGFRNMTVTDPDGNQLRFMEAGNAAEPSAAADGGRDFGSAENGSTGAVLTPAERSADSGRSAGAASCGGGGHRVTFGG